MIFPYEPCDPSRPCSAVSSPDIKGSVRKTAGGLGMDCPVYGWLQLHNINIINLNNPLLMLISDINVVDLLLILIE